MGMHANAVHIAIEVDMGARYRVVFPGIDVDRIDAAGRARKLEGGVGRGSTCPDLDGANGQAAVAGNIGARRREVSIRADLQRRESARGIRNVELGVRRGAARSYVHVA